MGSMIGTSLRARRPDDCASGMPFQPRIDPFASEPDRSPASDARVTKLATLAGGVDRVAAHAGVLRTFGHSQPRLHARLRAHPPVSQTELWIGVARSVRARMRAVWLTSS